MFDDILGKPEKKKVNSDKLKHLNDPLKYLKLSELCEVCGKELKDCSCHKRKWGIG